MLMNRVAGADVLASCAIDRQEALAPAIAKRPVRPEVQGKFLFVDQEKLYIRGVTYGTFRPDSDRNEFPTPACLVAPTVRGETQLADSPKVLDALPVELVEQFERVGWVLIRNYNEDIGASIAEAFGTDDRHVVESYCRANAIQFEWQGHGGLRTSQRRSTIVRPPRTGQRCWFNQIAFLNEWRMDADLHEYLVDIYGQDGLPFNTRFGNGDPIGPDVIELIDKVYEENAASEAWQNGDLLLVDNIRTAHGREQFEGPREVLVALADAVHLADCSPTIEVTTS
jgi:hypothetical protein